MKTEVPKVIRHTQEPVTLLQIDRLKVLAEAYVEGGSRKEYYPSPGMHCRWCAFRTECRAWNGVIQITRAA